MNPPVFVDGVLDCEYRNLTGEEQCLKEIVKNLERAGDRVLVRTMIFGNNRPTLSGMINVYNFALTFRETITSIDLRDNNFTELLFDPALWLLHNTACLQALILDGNEFTQTVVNNLIAALFVNTQLKTLSIERCGINDVQCQTLMQCLWGSYLTNITEVNILNNPIGCRGAYNCLKMELRRPRIRILYNFQLLRDYVEKFADTESIIAQIDEAMDRQPIRAERDNLLLSLCHSAVFIPRDIVREFGQFHSGCKLKIFPAFL